MSKNQLTPKNIIKYVEKIIRESFHQKRVESIANAAIGVVKAVDLKVQSIGHGLASMMDKQSKHAIKQIDRYLSNEGIDLGEFFSCWVKYEVGSLKEIVLAMDWTEFEADKQSTFTIHQISRHSRAMPLLWKSVEKESLKDKRNDYEDELLNQLKENLPIGIKVTILADRGFADTKLMELLTKLGFDYVIRIKKNFYVENFEATSKPAEDWLSDDSKTVMIKDALLTQEKFKVKRFVAVKDKNMKQAWFLVSSLEVSATTLIKLYAKRFTIEEGYRDFKDDRFGMGLSNTSIKSPARRDRLLIAAAIANILLTILGAAGEDLGYDRLLKSNTVKFRTHSLFRQGVLYFDKLPNMRPERKLPLLARFAELLSMHQLFAFQLFLA
jgi:hypothetical protein